MNSEPASKPSVTLNLLRLFITFRARIRRNLPKPRSAIPFRTCREDFEALAFDSLDKKLSPQNPSISSAKPNNRRHSVDKIVVEPPNANKPFDSIKSTSDPIESSLLYSTANDLDKYTKLQGPTLRDLAANDNLFLSDQPELSFGRHSWMGIYRMLLLTNDTIYSLGRVVSGLTKDSDKPRLLSISEEKFVANLEHLLLRIRGGLLAILVRKTIEIVEEKGGSWEHCWSKKKLGQADWFSEWPSGRRPLSTCWPWNIRPSLVVLWGVCWKFMDPPRFQGQPQSQRDSDMENVRVRGRTFEDSEDFWTYFPREAASETTYAAYTFLEDSTANAVEELDDGELRNANAGFGSARHVTSFPARAASPHQPQRVTQQPRRPSHPSFAFNPRLPDNVGLGTYATSAPDLTAATSVGADYNFPVAGASEAAYGGFWSDPSFQGSSAWLPGPQYQPPQQVQYSLGSTSTPHNIQNTRRLIPNPPRISVYPASTPTPATELYNHPFSLANDYIDNANYNDMVDNASGSFPSPTATNRSVSAEPPNPLTPTSHRRLSDDATIGSSENDSAALTTPAADRRGPPPRNAAGRIICTFASAECASLTFDRRCEWAKHMDKHDRPYVCRAPGCESLRGFTYSGGLLRHAREVHKQYGGPRKTLMCPYEDCKRHAGEGFTRKENLAEHVRRMHRKREGGVVELEGLMPGSRKRKRVSGSSTAGSPGGELARGAEYEEEEEEEEEEEQSDDLRHEIKRLRRENEEMRRQNEDKERRLQQLEAMLVRGYGPHQSHLRPPG